LVPRGVIPVATCLIVKGAEDVLNRKFVFEFSTPQETMYFVTDSEKEKEEWINPIGCSIVQHSRSITKTLTMRSSTTTAARPQQASSQHRFVDRSEPTGEAVIL
jgi:hypothetical protein